MNTPKAKILIIDDEAPFRFVLEKALSAEGYEVKTAENGELAVDLADSEPFDLMMIDLIMPQKDGFQTIVSLRESHPETRMIAMSGGCGIGATNYLRMAGKIGHCPTLAKPFSKMDMLEAIESELAMRTGHLQ
jgi:DNA-binding NtrC family response regulator